MARGGEREDAGEMLEGVVEEVVWEGGGRGRWGKVFGVQRMQEL